MIKGSHTIAFPQVGAASLGILLAILLGYYLSLDLDWLRLEFDFSRFSNWVLLAMGLLGAAAVIKWPDSGLIILVAVIYSNVSEIGVRYHNLPSVLQLLLPLLVFSILWRHLWLRERTFQFDQTLILYALYILLVAVSSVIATDSSRADEMLVTNLKMLCIFWVIQNLATSVSSLRKAVWTLVAVAALLGTISLFQVATHSYLNEFGGFGRMKLAQIVGNVREPRIAGPLSDPNFYAQILVMVLPVVLYRFWDESSIRLKVITAYSFMVALLAMVFTYSRGGALAVGFLLVLAGIERRIKAKYLMLTGAILVPLIFVVPEEFTGRLTTLEELVEGRQEGALKLDSSFEERKLYVQSAFEMFRDHPLLGVGAGNFATYYDEYADRIGSPISSYADFGLARYPHSLYLEIAAETGIAGLLVFGTIVLLTFYNAWSARRAFQEMGDHKSVGMITSLALGFAGYLITSLFLHADYIRYFWLLVALISCARIAAGKELRENHEAV